MEMLEKVELVREKCNVSYEEARDALEACEGNVLDAIVMLEKAHKDTERMAYDIPPAPDAAYELPDAVEPAAEPNSAESNTTKVGRAWKSFCATCKELFGSGMETTFIAERNGKRVFEVPLLLVVIGLLMWGASLWLLIAGLFLGFHYRIEGTGKAVSGVNSAMSKAADMAEDIKQSVA